MTKAMNIMLSENDVDMCFYCDSNHFNGGGYSGCYFFDRGLAMMEPLGERWGATLHKQGQEVIPN